MKKVLLIAAAAAAAAMMAVIIGLVVSDIVAEVTYEPGTLAIPQKTAFVLAYGGGAWFEATGDEAAPRGVFHAPGTPIPPGYAVALVTGWAGPTLKELEHGTDIRVRIPEAGVDLSYDRGTDGRVDSAAYWSGPVYNDRVWRDFLAPVADYEPPAGTPVYANHWWVGLSDTVWEKGLARELTADVRLPAGTYTVSFEEVVPEKAAGLSCIYDGPQTPYDPAPGPQVTAPFTFTVQATER